MTEIIRPETPNDYNQITKVNNLTFNQPNEGKMIEALRTNKKIITELPLVAEIDSKIPKQVRNEFTKKYKAQKHESTNTAVKRL